MRTALSQRTATATSLVGAVALAISLLSSPSALGAPKGSPTLALLQSQILDATRLHQLPATTTPALSYAMSTAYFSYPSFVHGCTPSPASIAIPSCVYGDVHAKRTVVLYGNSWAQQWVPAFDALGRAQHFRLVPIAKPACGTFYENGYVDPLGHVSTMCLRFAHLAVARMIALHPATIVVSSTIGLVLRPGASRFDVGADGKLVAAALSSPTPSQTAGALTRFVAALRASRAHVAVLGALPIPANGHYLGDTTPNECLLAHRSDIAACSIRTPVFTSAHPSSLQFAAAAAGVRFINVDRLFCAKGRCPLVVNGILVHFNTIHVSGPYASYVATALGALLGDVVVP